MVLGLLKDCADFRIWQLSAHSLEYDSFGSNSTCLASGSQDLDDSAAFIISSFPSHKLRSIGGLESFGDNNFFLVADNFFSFLMLSFFAQAVGWVLIYIDFFFPLISFLAIIQHFWIYFFTIIWSAECKNPWVCLWLRRAKHRILFFPLVSLRAFCSTK